MSTAALAIPHSPTTTSSSFFSDHSGSPPALNANTLALLDAFLSDKADQEQRFNELAAEQAAARIAGLALDDEHCHDEEDEEELTKPSPISVAEFRLAFGEDWQLSQFWYTEPFANHLARALHTLCTPKTTIAFLCCPTGFVAFQHLNPLPGAHLLEYDQRFAVVSPKQYTPYDLDEPDVFPEALRGKVDVAVVDPPFLNEVTNTKIAQTLRQILHPTRGKLLLITSTSIEETLHKIYDSSPIGPLRKTKMVVEHRQLSNDFAAWGSWEGAEDFGLDPGTLSDDEEGKDN